MIWLWGLLALSSVGIALAFWCALRIGAEADAYTDRAFQEMQSRRARDSEDHKEAVNDGDEA